MPLFESFGDVALDGDDAAVTDTLITAMDPVRDRLADLFAAAINDELTGKGWAKAVAGTVLDCKNPVEQTFHEPFRAATTRSIEHTFPSLSGYLEQSDHEEYLLDRDRIRTRGGLTYLLGPLSPGDYRRIGSALHGAAQIITITIGRRTHPSFDAGDLQFFSNKGGLSSIRVINSTEGVAEFGQQGEGLEFYALQMALETTEDEYYGSELEVAFEGMDVTVGVGDGEDPVMPDVIIAASEVG